MGPPLPQGFLRIAEITSGGKKSARGPKEAVNKKKKNGGPM